MKYIAFAFCFFFVVLSCSRSTEKFDETIYPKDSIIDETILEDYMVEIFLIEAAIYKAQHEGKSVQNYATEYYNKFFSTHQVSKHKLKMSIEYYISRKQMDQLLQNVVVKLTEIDIEHTPTKPDSTNQPEKKEFWLDTLFNTTSQN